jgi:hypothetical protein
MKDRSTKNPPAFPDLTIEELLTGTFSRRTLRRFGWRWLHIELAEGQAGIDQIRRDLVRTEQWKSAVMHALGAGDQDQAALADRWAGVIKLRIEALDSWGQLVGAFAAYVGGGCALLAVIGHDSAVIRTSFVALGIFIGVFGGMYRYYIDRHKGSNKFILACLEAARKG